MNKKHIILLLIISTAFFLNTLKALDIESYDEKEAWKNFVSNIKCTIQVDKKSIEKAAYPDIIIKLQYFGSSKYVLQWDKNFARVLWIGKFILISKKGYRTRSSTRMKYLTSNVYHPRQRITMHKGKIITSVFNVYKLPGRYAQSLYKNKGLNTFKLYAKVVYRLEPVSNQLYVKVK